MADYPAGKSDEPKKRKKLRDKMTDEEVVSIVDQEFDTGMSREGNDISAERTSAWDYYLSKPFGNEIEGNSSVVTTDVADVVDGIMPSLLRIFLSEDNLAKFSPVGKEDIDAAQQETDAIHHTLFVKNNAFLTFHTWFFDALVQKNGIVKAWWDASDVVTSENYEGLTAEELALLNEDEELEPVEQETREEEQMVPTQTALGTFPMPQMVTVYDVKYKRTSKRGKVCIAPVPPEEYRISSDANSPDPNSARFVGHERDVTRSDAIAMGFDQDLIMSLPASTEVSGEEKRARKTAEEERDRKDRTTDPSMELITLREAYIRMDYDGDGVAELRKVFVSGSKLLEQYDCDRQPFHVLTPKPMPHKHFGRSIAELVMDIQKINSTLLRQALDNLYHTNQPGHAVWEQAMGEDTLEDLLTTQTGRVARFTRPPSEAWAPMSIPFTANHSFEAIQYFDKAKRDRTGITQESEGLSPEALKHIQTSVLSQAIDVARGKVEAIARIFAETGVKSLLLHIHELMLKHQNKPEMIEMRGQYVPVDPREWREGRDMKVTVGLGLGTREQNLIHLNTIATVQEKIVANGGMGTLVTAKNIYNTAAQIVRNANLKHPELYFTDPETVPPQPEKPDAEKEVAMAMVKVEQEKNQLQAQKQQIDAQAEMLKMQQKMSDMQTSHQREIDKLLLQNKERDDRYNIEMEKIANQLTDMELKYATNVPGSKV